MKELTQLTTKERQKQARIFNEKVLPGIFTQLTNFNPKLAREIKAHSEWYPFKEVVPESQIHCGDASTGKTTKVMAAVINWASLRCLTLQRVLSFEIIGFASLLQEIRNTFKSGSEVTTQQVIDKYKNVPLLVLDDIGTCDVRDWSYSVLYMIIDYRWGHEKRTFYTSNYTLDQLAEMWGDDRLPRRIGDMCNGNIFEV